LVKQKENKETKTNNKQKQTTNKTKTTNKNKQQTKTNKQTKLAQLAQTKQKQKVAKQSNSLFSGEHSSIIDTLKCSQPTSPVVACLQSKTFKKT